MTKTKHNLPQMFTEMQQRCQGLVYSVIYGITFDAIESWNLTQEVFFKAYECDGRLEDPFRTFAETFAGKAWR